MAKLDLAAMPLMVLMLVVSTVGAAKVTMKAADCNLLVLKSDWTKITSCKTLPSCVVYNATDENQFDNIRCDKDGYVVYLSLYSSEDPDTGEPDYLTGPLPKDWYKFSRIQELTIDSSDLSGTLPAYWGYMKTLRRLSIQSSVGRSSAGIKGPIPTHWGALKNLERLQVSNLDTLSGKLPSELGLLKKLKELDLSGNSFNGILPLSIALLPSLKWLYLGGNKFIGDPTVFLTKLVPNPNLEELDFSGNGFSGRLPAVLAKAKNLGKINFQDCKFSGRLPSEWGSFRNLYEMNLQGNKGLVGGFPATWSKLPNLGTLYIGGTGIRGDMATFKNYRYIYLYIYPETQMCGDIPKGDSFSVSLWNFGKKITKLPKCK